MALTVGQIIGAAFNAALHEMRHGQPWVDPRLNELTKNGTIKLRELGAVVEDADGNVFPVQELTIPHVWTKKDEVDNKTENQKIHLARALIVNGIHSHDDVFSEMLKNNGAVVSKTYHYKMTPVEEVLNDNIEAYYMYRLYTAFAIIDK